MDKTIYFGAGCFWGVQSHFDEIPGVLETEVGYAGGHTLNPTYREVCSGQTGHIEVLKVDFDPKKVSLKKLAGEFFRMHNPTQANGQGVDIGEQYLSRIFTTNDEDLQISNEVLAEVQANFAQPIVTEVLPVKNYFKAEEEHQKYNKKHGHVCHVKLNW